MGGGNKPRKSSLAGTNRSLYFCSVRRDTGSTMGELFWAVLQKARGRFCSIGWETNKGTGDELVMRGDVGSDCVAIGARKATWGTQRAGVSLTLGPCAGRNQGLAVLRRRVILAQVVFGVRGVRCSMVRRRGTIRAWDEMRKLRWPAHELQRVG